MADEVKVYCKDCKFLLKTGHTPPNYKCNHPANLVFTDTWLQQKQREISTPQEINWNNNCPNFKQKGK